MLVHRTTAGLRSTAAVLDTKVLRAQGVVGWVNGGSCGQVRCMATHPIPYSKMKKLRRKEKLVNTRWIDANDPILLEKNLRYAEARATAAGDVARISEFDTNAASFANPPPLVAATLLERANVILRDKEDWEQDFLNFQADRADELNREYPKAFIDRTLAQTKVKETADDAGAGGARAEGDLEGFFVSEGFADEGDDSIDTTEFRPASRVTEADKINDTRSLDRALTQRLVWLVQNKDTGGWGLPFGERQDGVSMVATAEEALHDAFGPGLRAWYPGNAPVGFWLDVYDEEKQDRTGCYGAKVFFYRAQIFSGRMQLADEYADHQWLSRDELVRADLIPDLALKHYLHAIIGAGAGEEHWRRSVAADRRAAASSSSSSSSGTDSASTA